MKLLWYISKDLNINTEEHHLTNDESFDSILPQRHTALCGKTMDFRASERNIEVFIKYDGNICKKCQKIYKVSK